MSDSIKDSKEVSRVFVCVSVCTLLGWDTVYYAPIKVSLGSTSLYTVQGGMGRDLTTLQSVTPHVGQNPHSNVIKSPSSG